ncbi:cation:proton antiporter [Haploplasma axanthum]|uniref:Potassium/proton antiporter n=1 Tax=Haploplasma axanthum TaxID=29552 RepID=A0A449BDP1_HAPAX|nr:cation:proton antiporter [Haploplasma axanthum]VEU80574.1 potassium/proton antiporter [Haploplasma axanthum]
MIQSLGLIFLCGLLLGSLFKKLKLPSLIGMLISGIVIGPYVLNLLDDSILLIGPDLRELALIIILTRAGLSLDIEDLKVIGRPAVLMSFVPALFEIAATIIFAPLLLNITYMEAALLGAVIASASPAVIVPRMIKLMDEGYGTNRRIPQMILAGDSVDDVFNIVIFTMLLSFHTTGTTNALQLASVPISIILGVIVGIVSGFILSIVFNKIHMHDSYKVIMVLGIAFLMVSLEKVLEGLVPISGLLAVMVQGIVIFKKQKVVADRLSAKFNKLWTGAEIILFVMVGATVNIGFATNYLWQSILLLIIIISIRAIGILATLIETNLNGKERFFCTLTGIPKATVQAAIGGIPLAMGLQSGNVILSVAVIAILVTAPLGALLIDSTYKKTLKSDKYIEKI